jgi:hypothetical protein
MMDAAVHRWLESAGRWRVRVEAVTGHRWSEVKTQVAPAVEPRVAWWWAYAEAVVEHLRHRWWPCADELIGCLRHRWWPLVGVQIACHWPDVEVQ